MWEAIIERVIATEVEHQKMQIDYFTKREKVGEILKPEVYQPKHEPEEGRLVAVFIEPGAAHLVFRDAIAPSSELATRYRDVRQKVFGRVHDVESVEFVDGKIKFINNFSFFNLYETPLHWSSIEADKGALFSDTWNHMLSAGGKWINIIRGGYRLVPVTYTEGDRQAAEKWSPPPEGGV